jgi:hypothetical protein
VLALIGAVVVGAFALTMAHRAHARKGSQPALADLQKRVEKLRLPASPRDQAGEIE